MWFHDFFLSNFRRFTTYFQLYFRFRELNAVLFTQNLSNCCRYHVWSVNLTNFLIQFLAVFCHSDLLCDAVVSCSSSPLASNEKKKALDSDFLLQQWKHQPFGLLYSSFIDREVSVRPTLTLGAKKAKISSEQKTNYNLNSDYQNNAFNFFWWISFKAICFCIHSLFWSLFLIESILPKN